MRRSDLNSRGVCPLLMANGTATPSVSLNESTDSDLHHQLCRIADALEALVHQNGQALKPTYTVKEVAQILGKSEPTIRRWIREGRRESTKSGENQQGQHLIHGHSIQKYCGAG